MSKLDRFKKTDDVVEDKEFVGGSYYVPESGVYQYTLTKAYLDVSAKGSECVMLEATSPEHTLRTGLYFTSNKEKGASIFYKDREGKKKYLPSFLLVDDLCKVLTDKPFSDQDLETKTVKIWDRAAKKEVGQKRSVLVDLIGQDVLIALKKVQEDSYMDSSKEVTKLEIKKFFDVDTKRTAQEITNDLDNPDFYNKWLEVNKGVTEDKRKDSLNPSTTSSDSFDEDDSPFNDDSPIIEEETAFKESSEIEVPDETVEESVEEEEDLFND